MTPVTAPVRIHLSSFSGVCRWATASSSLTDDAADVTCKRCLDVLRYRAQERRSFFLAAGWTSLREQITRDAAIEQQLGDDYGDVGTDSSRDRANQHWGKAEALREVLAAMDRMEQGQ
jgi:hypothetical protein